MRLFKVLFGSLIFIVLFVAVWQNIPSILDKDITFRLDLYWVRWESAPIPIYLITPLCFLAGLVVMGIVDVGTIFKLRRRVKRLERQLALVSPPGSTSTAHALNETSSGSRGKWGVSAQDERDETAS